MAHPLPELGGHGLHIAHLLWGGFFIDELGKFITQDNDYFFKPAARANVNCGWAGSCEAGGAWSCQRVRRRGRPRRLLRLLI